MMKRDARSAHDKYIEVLNCEIDRLQAENKSLRNVIALLNENTGAYKNMLVRIEDLITQYQNEIKSVVAVKEEYQRAIEEAQSAERKYTEEFKSLLNKMKR